MGLILCLTRAPSAPLAIALLCMLVAGPALQAQTSQELKAATEHITHDIEDGIEKMQPVVEQYGYAGVVGAVFVEGFGLPAPGQTLLMAAAVEAARGHLNIGLLYMLAVLAAVAGNSLGYLIGKVGGRPLLRKLKVNEEREERIAALFERYGGGIIVLARFFDGPRQLNGIVAGTFGMRWWLFTVFNIVGAVLWVSVWGFGIYYLSEHVQAIDGFIRRINPWVSGVVAIGALAMAAYLFRGWRKRPVSAE